MLAVDMINTGSKDAGTPMKYHHAILLFAILLGASSEVSNQSREMTIPEIIQRTGKPIYRDTLAEYVPQSLDQLVSTADLLVHGRITDSHTYLTDDQMSLRTDYAFSPIQIGERSEGFNLRTAQGASPITVVRAIGETVIDNVPVKIVQSYLRPFAVGEELLLFLRYNKNTQRYAIVGGGHFAVKDNVLYPLTSHPSHTQYGGLTVTQFRDELSRTLANRSATPTPLQ